MKHVKMQNVCRIANMEQIIEFSRVFILQAFARMYLNKIDCLAQNERWNLADCHCGQLNPINITTISIFVVVTIVIGTHETITNTIANH